MHTLFARGLRRAAQARPSSTGVQGTAHLQCAQEMLDQTPMQLCQVPGVGRGLFAAQALPQGSPVHTEKPMLCSPMPAQVQQVCYHCLSPLTSSASKHNAAGHSFCSAACESTARAVFYDVEAALNLAPLYATCKAQSECFPLMVARAACMHLSKAVQPGKQAQSFISAADRAPQGNIWQDYRFLTFANIPPPAPPPWVQQHTLLQQAVDSYLQQQSQLLSDLQQQQLQSAAADLSLKWYISMMSRLHLNCFSVDGVLMASCTQQAQKFTLADMAAASVSSSDAALGSALYLLASLFNHSCSPNVTATFPKNNSTAHFVTLRDVEAGEELTVTYLDTDLNVKARQSKLQFAYGFTCKCPACIEDLTELASANNGTTS